jgi:hypothetical protein
MQDEAGLNYLPTKNEKKAFFSNLKIEKSILKRSIENFSSHAISDSFSRSKLDQLLLPKNVPGARPKSVKSCSVTKDRFTIPSNDVLIYSTTVPFFDGFDVRSTILDVDGFNALAERAPGKTLEQLFASADDRDHSDAFLAHDWFKLTSQFDEACDSLIPSSFLLGEDITENDIFIDAFKLVLNPSNIIKDFLNIVKKSSVLKKKRTLGAIANVLKGSANGWLSYNFAMKPAIEDIQKALLAHIAVDSRLTYLTSARGRFVPIRVRRVLPSNVDNLSDPTGHDVLYLNTSVKESIGCISAMGRVRDDLSWNDTWSAYLQYFGIGKVAGLAWELIPFSFVADWFVDGRQAVNELTRLHTGSAYSEITSICSSTKTVVKQDLLITPSITSVYGSKPLTSPLRHLLASRERSTYVRTPRIPETSGVVDFSTLGSFQVTALGSLLIQKFL